MRIPRINFHPREPFAERGNAQVLLVAHVRSRSYKLGALLSLACPWLRCPQYFAMLRSFGHDAALFILLFVSFRMQYVVAEDDSRLASIITHIFLAIADDRDSLQVETELNVSVGWSQSCL